MPRFWLQCGLLCALGTVWACGRRDIEGLWNGPLPAIAGDQPCQIRLLKAEAFDYRCEKPILREGAGRYSHENGMIVLTFEHLHEDGRSVRAEGLTSRFRIEGPGNRMELTPEEGGKPILWNRARL